MDFNNSRFDPLIDEGTNPDQTEIDQDVFDEFLAGRIFDVAKALCRQQLPSPSHIPTRNKRYKRAPGKVFPADLPVWMAYLDEAVAALKAIDQIEYMDHL